MRTSLLRAGLVLLFLAIAAVTTGPLAGTLMAARTHGGYYTAERLMNARRATETLSWARELREKAVTVAAPWVARSDRELWSMVPGQDLPRCIDVTLTRLPGGTRRAGCLNCGEAVFRFGAFPYEADASGAGWKIQCPACHARFPTNDFGAYYRSGLDERGVFDPKRADRALLFNAEHPEPGDPLRNRGVDDGFGYTDAEGNEYRFIGYFVWKHWRGIIDGLIALAEAFVLTGDRVYAHKAAVVLDRLADVYPDMDWKPYADRGWFHSDANRGVGKIEGAIWETNLARKVAESYDAILSGTLDDSELFAFLGSQGSRYRLPSSKGNRNAFLENVDSRFLRQVHDAILTRQIGGNEGMHQMAMVAAALALNTAPETDRWLAWLFEPDGGAIPGFILNQIDRDGGSTEAAPGYALFASMLFSRIAARLNDYPSYSGPNLFEEFPQLRASFTLAARLAVAGRAVPNLGDTGATGLISLAPADASYSALGFRWTGDEAMALAAYRTRDLDTGNLGRDLFAKEPDRLAREINRIGYQAGSRPVEGELLSGFGMATLEVGKPARPLAVACNFGRTFFHGHADTLNFDLLGFGRWLMPDHGYPEYATAWPNRNEWTTTTLSHNTVVMDGQPQRRSWGGKTRLFAQRPGVGVFQIDGSAAYSQADDYRRTLVLVESPDGENGCLVDVFSVSGGDDHLYSLHGPPGPSAVSGLVLAEQGAGTLAGPEVAYGAKASGFPVGFSYLYDVRRSVGIAGDFTVDWSVQLDYRGGPSSDPVHLRLHGFPEGGEVIMARGKPPQNRPGNPLSLEYVLQRRTGSRLRSTFVSVVEPYAGRPFLTSAQRIAAHDPESVVLKLVYASGEIDYVIVAGTGGVRVEEQGIVCSGRFGHIRLKEGRVTQLTQVDGTRLAALGTSVESPGAWTGRVVQRNEALTGGGWLVVDTLPPEGQELVGRILHIQSDSERDASYIIRGVQPHALGSRIDCGPISFVRGYDAPTITLRGQELPARYDHGYVYDFSVDATFRVPLVTAWRGSSQ